jgi:DNA-directed RNA polymerase subunit RPC12/RpoP
LIIRGKNHPRWNSLEYFCARCGKKFYRKKQKSNLKFCSTWCHDEWQRYDPDSKLLCLKRRKRKIIKCLICKKEFEVKLSHVKIRKNCSYKCLAKYRSKFIRKENHPSWKGGLSFLPYPPVFDDKLKDRIRERDGNKCYLCGKTEEMEGQKLNVHHIDYDKNNCLETNFITLCRICNIKVNTNRECWKFRLKGACNALSGN